MPQHFEDYCEDRARKGDGAFAVAFAIMRLADQQRRVANEINSLGLGNAATPHGALEYLAMQVSQAGDRIAEAISGLTPE